MAQFTYGNYSGPAGQVSVIPSELGRRDAMGRVYEIPVIIDVDGDILLTNTALSGAAAANDLSASEDRLRDAFGSGPRNDLNLYNIAGGRTALYYPWRNSIIGVPCTALSFPNPQDGAGEYVTKRRFKARFEAVVPGNTPPGTCISFFEQLRKTGNNRTRRDWQESVNAGPTLHEIYPSTVATYIQEGTAIGYLGYPFIPPPLFPELYQQNEIEDVIYKTPTGTGLTDFSVSWRYIFRSDVPLIGLPNIWPGQIPGLAPAR